MIRSRSLHTALAVLALWSLDAGLAPAAANTESDAERIAAATSLPADLAEALPLPDPLPPTPLHETTQGPVRFDSKTPFDFDVLLDHYDALPTTSSSGYLALPEGATAERPVAGVVLLPGSGGVELGRQMLYVDLLLGHGYAALVVDYYASRGIDDDEIPYPVMVTNVTEFDVVTDAYAALRMLQDHPAIAADRIAVVGFSYGGMATRMALDARLHALMAGDAPPFAAHVDFYGPCFQDYGTKRTTGAPLLTLRGARDASNELIQCTAEEERLRAAGSEVGSVVYATAGHSWGNLGPRTLTESSYVRGCTMEYDERGYPSVRGKPVVSEDDPIDRASRFRLRMKSGRFFEGCLDVGYLVGRDQATHDDANAELLRFLEAKLRH